jgi:hypothetical protein
MRKVGCDCSVRGRRECAGLKIQCTPAHDACNACVCRYDAVPGMQLPCRRSESRNLRHDMKARICIDGGPGQCRPVTRVNRRVGRSRSTARVCNDIHIRQ